MEIRINAEPEEVAMFLMKMGIKTSISDFEEAGEYKEKCMCTVDKAYSMLIEENPNIDIAKNHIRKVVRQKIIPVVASGNKYLFDYNDLLNYIAHPERYETVKSAADSKMKRVGVKQ